MKMIVIVALALVAAAAAAPASPAALAAEPHFIAILRSEFKQEPEGGYQYAYESEDGIQKTETGELKEALDEENKPHKVIVVRGSYSFPGAEGKPITINYFADETGYHAEGDSIPKEVSRR